MFEENKTEYFDCECHSPEHTLRITLDTEDGDLYTEVFLWHWPWWKRIWIGIKYMFGYTCRYGHFDCVTLVKEQDLDRLGSLVEKAKQTKARIAKDT